MFPLMDTFSSHRLRAKLVHALRRFAVAEGGATAIEYGLIAALTALAAVIAATVYAQASTDQDKMGGMKMDQTAASSEMTDAEVRKVDKENKKITLKHGDIKNLEMPGMTMLFQVKDLAMLDMVKPGDKVKFKAEKVGGAIVVTEIQVVK